MLGIGSSPGKTNLMAARAVQRAGRRARADRRVIAAAATSTRRRDSASPTRSQTLLDELTLAPVVLRDGEPVEIEPLTDGGEVDFGEPIGEGETIYTLHSELRTFGESFGCRECSFRLSLSPALLERAARAGRRRARRGRGRRRRRGRPSAETVSVHVVEARGRERRVARARRSPRRIARWGLGGGIVSTASPAAAAVRLLARGGVDARGALPPERCLDPADDVRRAGDARLPLRGQRRPGGARR